jgi:hypothetical protein
VLAVLIVCYQSLAATATDAFLSYKKWQKLQLIQLSIVSLYLAVLH